MVSPKTYRHSKGCVLSVRPEAFSQLRLCFPAVTVSRTLDHVSSGLSAGGTFAVAVTTPRYPGHGFGRATFKLLSTVTLSTILITVPSVLPLVFLIPAPRHTTSLSNRNQDFTPDNSPDIRTPAAPPLSAILSNMPNVLILAALIWLSPPNTMVAPGLMVSPVFQPSVLSLFRDSKSVPWLRLRFAL